jgi:rare lipoprotein A (peptidoglycan hydrolase)
MSLRLAIGFPVAAMVLMGGMMTDPTPAQVASPADDQSASVRQDRAGDTPIVSTIVQIAAITQESTQFAATAAIVAFPVPERVVAVETAPPVPPIDNSTLPARPADPPARAATKKRDAKEKLAAAEPKTPPVRVVGKAETGTAAWYGDRYVGRRTSSGERLDTIHATAAHRSLPLNSLVRVTNLRNGRSVIVRVTDRGPLSESLLIDVSPRAAEQLEMKTAGLVPVKVEQVVALQADAR